MNVDRQWLHTCRKGAIITDSRTFKEYSTGTPPLQAALVSAGHHAELFSNRADVVFFRDMIWILNTEAAIAEIGTLSARLHPCKKTVEWWQTSLPAVFMASRKADLVHSGYLISDGMADSLMAASSMYQAAGKPYEYLTMPLKQLYSFLLETLPGVERLKDRKKQTLWNPVFNHAKSICNQDDRENELGRCLSTKKLFIEHNESVEQAKS